MKRFSILYALLLLSIWHPNLLLAQELFDTKIKGCVYQIFCLDCGEPKANYVADDFQKIAWNINSKYNFKGKSGSIIFQVLVDSVGKGCVISHSGAPNNSVAKDLVLLLNQCNYTPAINDKAATMSSINIIFTVEDEKISGSIKRINQEALQENMSNPGKPSVYNAKYRYKNPSLDTYDIEVWQKSNSALPYDMSVTSKIDNADTVWYSTYKGFVRSYNGSFELLTPKNSPFKKDEHVRAIGIDQENKKWVSTSGGIYRGNFNRWEKMDSTLLGISSAYHINSTTAGEVLLAADGGLSIYKDGKVTFIDKNKIPELPSDRVYDAYRDRSGRLWIGTFSGTIMIDAANKITSYNNSATPLNFTCASNIVEDENGNLYFSLYDFVERKNRDSEKQGIAVLTKEGTWIHYNDKNSGLPSNSINALLYDRFEKVLWIGTNNSGLVRFDLNKGWEMYHNENSKVPSTYIFELSQDSKGNIYASTFNGMMRIKKR